MYGRYNKGLFKRNIIKNTFFCVSILFERKVRHSLGLSAEVAGTAQNSCLLPLIKSELKNIIKFFTTYKNLIRLGFSFQSKVLKNKLPNQYILNFLIISIFF